MTGAIAWVNGELVPLADARVSVLDEGFRTGLGVFETMRAYGPHVFALRAHLERARRGCDALRIEAPPLERLTAAVEGTVAATRGALAGRPDAGDLAVRLTLTPGPLDAEGAFPGRSLGRPTIVATAQPLVIDPSIYTLGIRAITVNFVRPHAGVKAVSHLTSMLARTQAREAGVDEALLTHDGLVAEGAASNVFLVVDGSLVTPDSDMLAGVTRAQVLALAEAVGIEVRIGQMTVADMHAADEAFVTASTREIVPLVEVDGQPIGAGAPGPVTARIHAAYRQAVVDDA